VTQKLSSKGLFIVHFFRFEASKKNERTVYLGYLPFIYGASQKSAFSHPNVDLSSRRKETIVLQGAKGARTDTWLWHEPGANSRMYLVLFL
jgi:hypothetical protein